MKTIRNISCVLLLAALLAPLAFQLWGGYRLHCMHENFERRLEREQQHTLHIAAAELQWARQGKELIYNGHLFDVQQLRLQNGVYIVKGLFDEEEKALKEKLAQSPMHRNWQQYLAKIFLQQLYVTNFFEPNVTAFFGYPEKPSTLYRTSLYQSICIALPGKPPSQG